MKSISNRARIRVHLRELSGQLALLNRRVGDRVDLREADIGCLDLLARGGPRSPTALAREVGIHPATLTGMLDRLETAGWVARERDPDDRRAVLVRALPDRAGELMELYARMNGAIDRICAGYGARELAVIADFLERATAAGREVNDENFAG